MLPGTSTVSRQCRRAIAAASPCRSGPYHTSSVRSGWRDRQRSCCVQKHHVRSPRSLEPEAADGIRNHAHRRRTRRRIAPSGATAAAPDQGLIASYGFAQTSGSTVPNSAEGDAGPAEAVGGPGDVTFTDAETHYIIATDLRVFGGDSGTSACGDWCHWSSNGSTKLNVWESKDLVTWSDLRQFDVATTADGVTRAELGMAWTPEATWVPDYRGAGEGAFVVYWSSNLYDDAEHTGDTYSRVMWGGDDRLHAGDLRVRRHAGRSGRERDRHHDHPERGHHLPDHEGQRSRQWHLHGVDHGPRLVGRRHPLVSAADRDRRELGGRRPRRRDGHRTLRCGRLLVGCAHSCTVHAFANADSARSCSRTRILLPCARVPGCG